MTNDAPHRWHPNVYDLARSMAAAYAGAAPEPALTDQDQQSLADELNRIGDQADAALERLRVSAPPLAERIDQL